MKKILSFLLKRHWKKIFLIVIFTYINVVSQLDIIEWFPIIVFAIKDYDFTTGTSILPDLILPLTLSIISSIVISYLSVSVSSSFAHELKEKLYNILLNLNTIDEFNKINYSGVMTRLVRGVDTEQSFVLILLRRVLLMIFVSLAVVYYIYWVSLPLAFAFLLFIIISAFIFILRLNQLANLYFKVKKLYGKLNALYWDKISNIKIVHSYSKEEYSNNVFRNEAENAYNKGFRFQYKLNFSVLWMIVVNTIAILFILNLFWLFRLDDDLSMDLFFALLCIIYFMNHLTMLAPFVSIYPLAYTSAVRIEEVLALEKNSTTTDFKKESAFDEIEFRDVSLSLSGRQILSNVSFKIPKNSKTLIVGPVGSGKTSLIYSLMGFYKINAGEIITDNNINFSLTTTKSVLFKDSVFENIRLGDESIGYDDALNACSDALFTKDLLFEVNEDANNLSNDFKQRLAIARALAHDSELYIFDNCFISIDSNSKKIIIENIKKRLNNKTVIIIDDALEDYSYFDNIIVLKNGKIESQGSHEYLINNSDFYKELFKKSGGGVNE